jgi:hypothetical protein
MFHQVGPFAVRKAKGYTGASRKDEASSEDELTHQQSCTLRFRQEVADRFGVLPNFFCSADAAPGLVEELWKFAKSAYLDSPLPSLFKERLFVHLSRFCEIRYFEHRSANGPVRRRCRSDTVRPDSLEPAPQRGEIHDNPR